jgi:O-antigen/teichoic acid export membrane protein
MQRKFLTNLLLIVILNGLIKPFYLLGIDAEIQVRVGEEVYGNYFSLLNFSFLLNILLDLGLTNYNTRNIAQHPKLIVKHFYKILSVRFSIFILYAVFTSAAGFLIGYNSYEFYLLSILMVNQFFVAIIQFSRSNFAGLHLFKTDAFISVLDRSLLIIICSMMLWTNWFGGEIQIEWFIYAQTVAYGSSAVLSLFMLRSKVGRLKLDFKKAFTRVILKKSFPYALLILLMMLYNRMDAVMIERLLPDGNRQAGIYAQGFRILDAVNMFALLFAGLLLPIFARLLKERKSILPMTGLAFRILFTTSSIVAISAFFFRDELMLLRYPDSGEQASMVFGTLILSFIPVSITYVYGTLLTANGSLKQLNIMAFVGLLLNFVLNIILIQKYNAFGAALATLITQVLTAIVQVFLAVKLFKMPLAPRLFGAIILFVCLLLGINYYALQQSTIQTIWLLIPVLILGLVLAFAVKLIKLKDLKVILSDKEMN